MSQRLIATLLTTTQPEGFQLYQGEVKSKWFHPLTWCLQSFLFVLAGHGARKHWWCCTRVAQNNTKMLTAIKAITSHTLKWKCTHVYNVIPNKPSASIVQYMSSKNTYTCTQAYNSIQIQTYVRACTHYTYVCTAFVNCTRLPTMM